MNSAQFRRGRPEINQLRSGVGKATKKKYVSESSSQKGFKQSHLPMLEASFLECLCMECRANYLIFKDLDRQGVDFFPKRMERKALDQNNERKSWVSPSQGRNEKPWLVSKRNVSSSPVLPASNREYPPSKKVNTGKAPMDQGNEVQKEQFTLVKGVLDWFLKKVKPELFQGYKDPSKFGNKMVKPPNTTAGQWVVIRDPKTKTPQMVPMLTRTQKRKLQRRYTSFQMEEYAAKENSNRGNKFNLRFNRLQKEDSEDSLQKEFTQSEKGTLESLAARMDNEMHESSPVSPHSLASYQSGLLEAMIVEQEEGGGTSSSPIETFSPMETSAMGSIDKVDIGEDESEQQSFEVRTI